MNEKGSTGSWIYLPYKSEVVGEQIKIYTMNIYLENATLSANDLISEYWTEVDVILQLVEDKVARLSHSDGSLSVAVPVEANSVEIVIGYLLFKGKVVITDELQETINEFIRRRTT